ncbi:MAG: hypothetical protein JOZ31_09535 [Verrucomicrobia bacterium]|nr:hypothetical protein [Verrucomicrobiota bacterium]MBV8485079.1 hypothetical protein [Verrucomicrobiota bacterium]
MKFSVTYWPLRSVLTLIALLQMLSSPEPASAHGFAGDRFFPATITTDDPFAASEMSLPTILYFRQPGSPPTKTIDFSSDISILVLPNVALTLGDGYQWQKAAGQSAQTGFNNFSANLLYEFFENDEHEAIMSVGFTSEFGGTGSSSVGSSSFSTLTPILYFGKGLGDLPTSWNVLRPFAVTGEFGLAIPTRSNNRSVTFNAATGQTQVSSTPNPDVFQWGFAVEYSLIYLQEHVKNIGLHAPFDRMIPLVEFSMSTPVDRHGGTTTGTINPGVIWSGQYFQVGVEAVLPVNDHTGFNPGVVGQVHFYLDDILPKIFSKPLL